MSKIKWLAELRADTPVEIRPTPDRVWERAVYLHAEKESGSVPWHVVRRMNNDVVRVPLRRIRPARENA